MDDTLKYFENKDFVQWVLNPNADLDLYWQTYLQNNPLEKNEIDKSRLIILALKSKQNIPSNDIEDVILSNIIREINVQKKAVRIRRISFSILKYAAVFFLLLSISISYRYYRQITELDRFANQLVLGGDQENSQLILADGNKVLMGEKKSDIVYGESGEIIINNNDTVNNKKTLKTADGQFNQLIVPFGKRANITLSDGTIVHLNAGSKLVYPPTFDGDKREVFLVGEAFFEVFHNKKKPFIVKTNNQNVTVLGTKFNVSAYPSDKVVETVLAEGSVKLKPNDFSFFKEEHILKPNQKACFNKENKKLAVSKVDAKEYVSWYLGYLNLETSELKKIIKRVERYYDIRIDTDNNETASKTITGKLVLKDNAESVMEILAAATSMELIKLNETSYVLK